MSKRSRGKVDRKYLRNRRGTWYIDFTDPRTGERIKQSLRTNDLDTARANRDELLRPFTLSTTAEQLAAIAKRIDVVQRQSAVPMVKAWQAYVDSPNRPDSGPRTLEGYERQWDDFRRWMATSYPKAQTILDVTEQHAAGYAASRKGDAPSTYNQRIGTIRRVYETLTGSPGPFRKVRNRTRDPLARRKRNLTGEEVQTVIDRAEGDLRHLFLIGLCTGQRLSDCVHLRWSQIDMRGGMIEIYPAKTRRRKAQKVSIPIFPQLRSVLASMDRTGDYVLPGMVKAYAVDRGSTLSGVVKTHFEACGIRTAKEGTGRVLDPGGKVVSDTGKRAIPEVTFHSMRHTFVTWAAREGLPNALIRAITGHSSDDLVQHYTHFDGGFANGRNLPALPAADNRDRVLALLDGMTGRNWKATRDELRAMIAGGAA